MAFPSWRNQPQRAAGTIEMKDGKCTLWVKLRNTNHIISGWYSVDGKTWRKYPWGYDMQGFWKIHCALTPYASQS